MNNDGSNQDFDKIIANKFELKAILGKGASSIVYKARHTLLDQDVAVKIFAKDFGEDNKALERFKKEASLLSSFSHPNIPKFLSFGETDEGQPFIAIEFIEGETLAERLKSSPLTEDELKAIVTDISSALKYAHERGIVHRDIKPSNVILDSSYSVARLLDFGIFKNIADSNQKLTKTGLILGSFNYMSPEQCKMKPLDARSDIYSLGCLMYEALAGSPPMDDQNDFAILNNHANKIIKSVPANKGISRDFENVIIKCLQKDPSNRFQSVDELSNAISRAKDTSKSKTASVHGLLRMLPYAAAIVLIGVGFFFLIEYKKQLMIKDRPRIKTLFGKSKMPSAGADNLQTIQQCEDWLAQSQSSDLKSRMSVQWMEGLARVKTGYWPKVTNAISDREALEQVRSTKLQPNYDVGSLQDFERAVALTRILQDDLASYKIWSKEILKTGTGSPTVEKYAQVLALAAYYQSCNGDFAKAKEIIEPGFPACSMAELGHAQFDLELSVARSKFYAGIPFEDELRKSLKSARTLIKANKKLPQYGDWVALFCECGMQKEILAFMQEYESLPDSVTTVQFNSANHYLDKARMQIQECRAEIDLQHYSNAIDLSKKILNRCLNSETFTDVVCDEGMALFLRARHQSGMGGNTDLARNYIAKLLDYGNVSAIANRVQPDNRRAIAAAPAIWTELLAEGIDPVELAALDEKQTTHLEDIGNTEIKLSCAELRLALGKFAFLRKQYPAAERFFKIAVADTEESNSIRSNYIKALSLQLYLEAQRAQGRDDQQIEERLNKMFSSPHLEDTPHGLAFLHAFLKLRNDFKFEPTTNKKGENKQLNKLERLMDEYFHKAPLPMLDSYPDALIFLIDNSAGSSEQKFADRLKKIQKMVNDFNIVMGNKIEKRRALNKSFITLLKHEQANPEFSADLRQLIEQELAVQLNYQKTLEKMHTPGTKLYLGDPFRTLFWLEARLPD